MRVGRFGDPPCDSPCAAGHDRALTCLVRATGCWFGEAVCAAAMRFDGTIRAAGYSPHGVVRAADRRVRGLVRAAGR